MLFRAAVRRLAACVAACLFLLHPAHADEPAQAAEMIEAAVPEYPRAAERQGVEGSARILARVLASGQPVDIQVRQSAGMAELDQAAVTAVARSKFRPAQSAAGVAVDSWVVVPFRFVLKD